MCDDFRTYAPVRQAEVGSALRERDAERLRQAAHKFCPWLFAFSTVAGNVASELEDLAATRYFAISDFEFGISGFRLRRLPRPMRNSFESRAFTMAASALASRSFSMEGFAC